MLNKRWYPVIFLALGMLLGSASTGFYLKKYYEHELISDMMIGNSINILGGVNILNSLKLNNDKQALLLLESDLDTNLITIGMFEKEMSDDTAEKIRQSINAAAAYRAKYPFVTENKEWNAKVEKVFDKFK